MADCVTATVGRLRWERTTWTTGIHRSPGDVMKKTENAKAERLAVPIEHLDLEAFDPRPLGR